MPTYKLTDDPSKITYDNDPISPENADTLKFWEEQGLYFKMSLKEGPFLSHLRTMELMEARDPKAAYLGMGYTPEFINKELPTEPTSPLISKEQWDESPYARKDLDFYKMADKNGMVREEVARIIAGRKDEENALNEALSKSPGGALRSVAKFPTMMAAQFLDPVNIASAFIPISETLSYMRVAEKLGKVGRLGKIAETAITKTMSNKYISSTVEGAIDGIVGNALVEPIVYNAAVEQQANYNAMDALFNVVAGGVLGGGLHLTGTTFKQIFKRGFKHTDADIGVILDNAIDDNGVIDPRRAVDMINTSKKLERNISLPEGESLIQWRMSNIIDDADLAPRDLWTERLKLALPDDMKDLAEPMSKLMNGEEITVRELTAIKDTPIIKQFIELMGEDYNIADIGQDLKTMFNEYLLSDSVYNQRYSTAIEELKEIATRDYGTVGDAADGMSQYLDTQINDSIDIYTKALNDIEELSIKHPDDPLNKTYANDSNRKMARMSDKYWDELPEDTREFLLRHPEWLDIETGEMLNVVDHGVRGGLIEQIKVGLENLKTHSGEIAEAPIPNDHQINDTHWDTIHNEELKVPEPEVEDINIFSSTNIESNINKMLDDIGEIKNIMHNKGLRFAEDLYEKKYRAFTNEELLRNKLIDDWVRYGEGKELKDFLEIMAMENNLEGTKLDRIETRKIIEDLQDKKNFSPTKTLQEIGEEMKLEYAEFKQSNLRAFAYSLLRRAEAVRFIDEFMTSVVKSGKNFTEYDAIWGMLLGKIANVKNAGFSVDYLAKSHGFDFLGHLESDLRKYTDESIPGKTLYDIAMNEDPELTADIAKEMFLKAGGKGESTGNNIAIKIAEIYHKYNMITLKRLNSLGAYVKVLPGYIIKQTHNIQKIKKASFNNWFDNIKDTIDIKKTFGEDIKVDDPDLKVKMREIYDNIIVGRYQEAMYSSTPMFNDSITKRVSASRELVFKDSDAWLNYNKLYGNEKTITNGMISGLRKAGKDIAILERLGPDPHSTLDQVLNDAANMIKEVEGKNKTKRLDELNNKKDRLHLALNAIEGIADIPESVRLAAAAASIRQVINMAKLGAVTISSLADLPAAGAELTANGMRLSNAWGEKFQYAVGKFGTKEEQREFARLIGLGLEHLNSDLVSKFTVPEGVTGLFSRAQTAFFKANMLELWTNSIKRSTGLQLSSHVGTQLKTSTYANLNKDLKSALKRYGIEEAEWDLLRKVELEGEHNLFIPDAIQNIPDNDIIKMIRKGFYDRAPEWAKKKGAKITPKIIEEARIELENKVRTYFLDRVETAVPTPGTAERVLLYRDTKPGTPHGEALRFLMQFKSFGATYTRKVLGRETRLIKGSALKNSYHWIGHLAVPALIMSSIVGWAKDFVSGKEFRDYSNPKHWGTLVAQSGVGGIYTDFLFGMQRGYGRGALSSLLGPAAATIEDISGIGIDIIKTAADRRKRFGRNTKIGSQVFKTIKENTPFQNIFYTKLLTDLLFTYSLEEALDRGSARRRERALRKRTGQRYIEGFGPTDRFRLIK